MQAILTLNSGSSSIKFAVFTCEDKKPAKAYSGFVDHITTTEPYLKIKDSAAIVVCEKELQVPEHVDAYEIAINTILEELQKIGIKIVAAGHRVVHGAMKYRSATIVDDEVLNFLERLSSLAPLHQPYNLRGIEILRTKHPDLLQVACFDTAFHTTCNELTQLFAIPKWLTEEGVRRYGFHGLSYEYVVSQFNKYLPQEKADGKIIIMHLGQGASMCGVVNHKSFAVSVGFSALDGLPMGTRSGSFDPGAILYLMQAYQMDHKRLERLFYKESGLLGISGISSDMRVLLNSDSPDARLAIDLFAYRVGSWVGMLAAEMQGLDGLVFTAGIGENAPAIREKICERAAWLGAKIDQRKNLKNSVCINCSDSKLSIHVIPTDEELMIAAHTFRVCSQQLVVISN
ncbi:Acetate kinase [Gammaproteobacteria bacterium]